MLRVSGAKENRPGPGVHNPDRSAVLIAIDRERAGIRQSGRPSRPRLPWPSVRTYGRNRMCESTGRGEILIGQPCLVDPAEARTIRHALASRICATKPPPGFPLLNVLVTKNGLGRIAPRCTRTPDSHAEKLEDRGVPSLANP